MQRSSRKFHHRLLASAVVTAFVLTGTSVCLAQQPASTIAAPDAPPFAGALVTGLIALCLALCLILVGLRAASLSRKLREKEQFVGRLRHLNLALERRHADQEIEFASLKRQLEIALHAAHTSVFLQDRDLIYDHAINPPFTLADKDFRGRTDVDMFGDADGELSSIKRKAMMSGECRDGEVDLTVAGSTRQFRIVVSPGNVTSKGLATISCLVDVTDAKQREHRIHLLLGEVTHRSKNLLAVILAMARQSQLHAASLQDYADRLTERTQSLAQLHDLLVASDWSGARMRSVALSQIAPLGEEVAAYITIEGPEVWLTPEAAQNVGMAIHELAINAVKYGALSAPGGRASVTWRRADHGADIVWRETADTPMPQTREWGFGRTVLERIVPKALNAKCDWTVQPLGLEWKASLPAACLSQAHEETAQSRSS